MSANCLEIDSDKSFDRRDYQDVMPRRTYDATAYPLRNFLTQIFCQLPVRLFVRPAEYA